ncbi:hypothetical protein OQA88_12434 [Cercophora sp. LCS_1]
MGSATIGSQLPPLPLPLPLPVPIPMTFGSSENRAATMSTASGPSPPAPLSERSTSPDRKSRTLQGPSPKEWARHRETIIDLYRQFPLKKVSEIMRKHHGFSAR